MHWPLARDLLQGRLQLSATKQRLRRWQFVAVVKTFAMGFGVPWNFNTDG
ncbi:MAG: hypothetical protein Q8K24_05610 [Hydrogenophaga sp.]|nr:hypothetical protein [Hydrogenophaga sp.]